MNVDVLIKALRCTGTPGGTCDNEECPWRIVEKVPAEDKMYDLAGTGLWVACDCYQMANDAADVLETMSEQIKSIAERLEKIVESAGKDDE